MKMLPIVVLTILAFTLSAAAQSMFDKVNDYDGDHRADYVVTRNENGLKVWYLWQSTAGFRVLQWGVESDVVTAGDYDGDSRTDIAVTRLALTPPPNDWIVTTYYVASSTNTVEIVQFRTFNAVGATGVSNEDYDADGKTDVGLFQWHAIGGLTYRRSSDGGTGGVSMEWFQVRTGDLVGNGAAEIVSWNPNTGEATVTSPQGSQFVTRWGVAGDRWVAADFDGDNKGEMTIFRPSTGQWWSLRTSDFTFSVRQWGIDGDVPVPADYDGDGKSDLAVWRPGTPQSTYWVLGSTAGFSGFGFGVATDSVVTY